MPSQPQRTPSSYSHSHSHSSSPTPKRSYILPLSILIGIVLFSASQTEVAHHLSTDLGYSKTYFTFYFTHSTFTLVFPLHLLLLYLTTSISPLVYLASIQHLLSDQLGLNSTLSHPHATHTSSTATWRTILPLWTRKVTYLTLLVSVPALSWFIAMSLSTPMDITAIYATSSFAAYGFSLLLLGGSLSKITAGSVALAFAGVVVISLDGVDTTNGGKEMGRRALGDAIMLFGALMLGLYEVVYKLALPPAHGGHTTTTSPSHTYSPLPTHHSPPTSPSNNSGFHHRSYPSPPIPLEPPSANSSYFDTQVNVHNGLQRTTSSALLLQPKSHGSSHPITLPPALHANFLTSCIGLTTLLLLWPPIIGLHWLGYETFEWPGSGDTASSWKVWLALEVVAWSGSLYNAGLMVLIGIWGPTTSSVANLLTIGLVAIVDALWTGYMPDLQTFLGVGMICVGFGVLLWEGEG
ncbi:hypothetical protein CI109_104678 [Kwoniella shandongensis]|uniref:Uncharacterized protein n=1 Tax=Kwoniella shandongensis TaxID=1734106 RepID=A0A5M6BVX9_9TREE|nr:uncharacterized protein CI109_004843 [Kwoniella shandongensis]KAA5526843.1 hypothetical protein CI109_004843 [Kwoniella shandongensis]